MTLTVTELPDGTAEYVTTDGDMIDQIAFAYYGTLLRTAEAIYEANQNLSLLPIVMPAGVRIILPQIRAADAARAGAALELMGRL